MKNYIFIVVFVFLTLILLSYNNKRENFSSGTMMQMESNRGSRTDSYLTGLNNPYINGYDDAKKVLVEGGYDLENPITKNIPINVIGWMPNLTDKRTYKYSRCR